MLTPVQDNWGLGSALYTTGVARFGHDGVNEGFQSFTIAYVGPPPLPNHTSARRIPAPGDRFLA